MRTLRSASACICSAAALLALGACDSLGNMLSPGEPAVSAPARLALQASIPRFQQSAFEQLELRVFAEYQTDTVTFAPLDTKQLPLTNATTQQVAVAIDLGRCLKAQAVRGTREEPIACTVRLTLTLLGDGRTLDSFQISDLQLAPGKTSTAPQSVQLFEIASVAFTSFAGGSVPAAPVSLIVGNSASLGVTVFDGTGAQVESRAVSWSSGNSAVATVSESGNVTAVAPGSTLIRATVGGREATLEFVVVPPTQRLEVNAVPGNGTGRLVSSPSGIDCTVAGGVASGICTASFPFGTAVTLSAVGASATSALFDGWTGACLSNSTVPDCTILMDTPRSAGGSFSALGLLTVAEPSALDGIVVRSTAAGPVGGTFLNCNLGNYSGNCALPFLAGATVTLNATESLIARATGWLGCDASSRTSCTVNVDTTPREVELQGTFGNVIRARLGTSTGLGVVTASNVGGPGVLAPLNCGPAATPGTEVCASGYPAGSIVTVRATSSPGSRFVGWSDPDCDVVSGSNCTITNTSGDGEDIDLDFAFVNDINRITLQLSGTGGGFVFGRNTGNVLCTLAPTETFRECELTFPRDTSIVLNSTCGIEELFDCLGGDCGPGSNCTLLVDQPRLVTVMFSDVQLPTLVRVRSADSNTGFGTVITDDESIVCEVSGRFVSGLCNAMLLPGTVVTFTAIPDAMSRSPSNHVFGEWSSGRPTVCNGSTNPECTVTVDVNGPFLEVSFIPVP